MRSSKQHRAEMAACRPHWRKPSRTVTLSQVRKQGDRSYFPLNTMKCGISCDGRVLIVTFVSAECQLRIGKLEAELGERSAQVDALTVQLKETQAEKSQLVEKVSSVSSLLEASQANKEEDKNKVTHTFPVKKFSEVTTCVTTHHHP